MLELYDFRKSLFYHGKLEEFLSFIRNFQMTLAATVTIETEVKVHYLRILVCGEVLRKFYLLGTDVEITDTSLNIYYLLKGLAWYFSLWIR